MQLFGVATIRNYILRNLLFEVPWLRRRLFLADARKGENARQTVDLVAQTVTTSDGSVKAVPNKADFGTLSSGGLY